MKEKREKAESEERAAETGNGKEGWAQGGGVQAEHASSGAGDEREQSASWQQQPMQSERRAGTTAEKAEQRFTFKRHVPV